MNRVNDVKTAPLVEAKVGGAPYFLSDQLARGLGQGLHHVHQLGHEVCRAAVVVTEKDGIARFALDD